MTTGTNAKTEPPTRRAGRAAQIAAAFAIWIGATIMAGFIGPRGRPHETLERQRAI